MRRQRERGVGCERRKDGGVRWRGRQSKRTESDIADGGDGAEAEIGSGEKSGRLRRSRGARRARKTDRPPFIIPAAGGTTAYKTTDLKQS